MDSYKLTEDNYYSQEFPKTKIVVGNSLSYNMSHFSRWLNRLNGKNKNTAHYTITMDGEIHKHFDEKYFSDFINIGHIDRNVISIVLENEGWLQKDLKNKCYINWVGDIYNRADEVVDVKWRGRQYWAPYTIQQFESLVKLCNKLTDEFQIPREVVNYNIKLSDYQNLTGIFYRSNFSKYYYDLSPAFDFIKFKESVEIKDEK